MVKCYLRGGGGIKSTGAMGVVVIQKSWSEGFIVSCQGL